MANTKEALSNADLLTSLPNWCQRKGTELYIVDKEMCSFCLLHKEDTSAMGGKPAYQEPECNEGHIKWLHNIMKVKNINVNLQMSAREGTGS